MAAPLCACKQLALLIIFLAACSRELSPASAQLITTPVTQRSFTVDEAVAQTWARAAYFDSFLNAGSANGPQNFAATPVDLDGGFGPLGTFVVNVGVGSPPVTLPVVVDTGSHVNFVQGPDCITCSNCSPFNGGPSDCPFTNTIYNPALSSTAATISSCAACASGGIGATGCKNITSISPANTCQFKIQFGAGDAAGRYVKDVVSVGSLSSGSTPISLGITTYESQFDGTAGLFGFGPTDTSLPFQLKAAGAVTSSTFALCLASGYNKGGTLYLGGAPTQPSGVTYTTPLQRNPNVLFLIPKPVDVLLDGKPINGAAAALASGSNDWIVDSAFMTFSDEEVYARFPILTFELQGTTTVARPKSYLNLNFRNATGRYVMPGIVNGGVFSTYIIGDTFMTDNL
ncbi:hypothetical protein KFL_015420010, partial [Klebsormidium nitens]